MSSVRIMFCKFCRDAGRDDYTSHNVRGPGGKLTCKFLAQIECQYCGEKGHTSGYCALRLKKESAERRWNIRAEACLVEKTTTAVKRNSVVLNPFALLEEEGHVVETDLERADLEGVYLEVADVGERSYNWSETDDEISGESSERDYDEIDIENARNCTIDFSTIPLNWGMLPKWI